MCFYFLYGVQISIACVCKLYVSSSYTWCTCEKETFCEDFQDFFTRHIKKLKPSFYFCRFISISKAWAVQFVYNFDCFVFSFHHFSELTPRCAWSLIIYFWQPLHIKKKIVFFRFLFYPPHTVIMTDVFIYFACLCYISSWKHSYK